MFSSIQTLIKELMKKKNQISTTAPIIFQVQEKIVYMQLLSFSCHDNTGHVTTQNVLFSKSQKMCTAIKCASSVSDIAGCCVISIILSHTISRIGMASSPLTKTGPSLWQRLLGEVKKKKKIEREREKDMFWDIKACSWSSPSFCFFFFFFTSTLSGQKRNEKKAPPGFN